MLVRETRTFGIEKYFPSDFYICGNNHFYFDDDNGAFMVL
jgi:hypothetical protein